MEVVVRRAVVGEMAMRVMVVFCDGDGVVLMEVLYVCCMYLMDLERRDGGRTKQL